MALSLLARARQLVSGVPEPPATPAPASAPGDSYRQVWNSNARGDAMTAILTPTEGGAAEAQFDEAGLLDAEWLRKWVEPDAVVLDVGCGIGRIEKHLAPHVARVCSVDVSDEMLAKAREWTSGRTNIEFYRSSSTDLSVFPDVTFDFVFSYYVLQHTDHEDAFLTLREIARVLKVGGTAVIQFPHFLSHLYGAAFVRQAESGEKHPARVRMYTFDFVSRMIELAGLRLDHFEHPSPGSPIGTLNDHEIVAVIERDAATSAPDFALPSTAKPSPRPNS